MSTNRCFETLDIVNGSDRTTARRQSTIYLEMQRNAATVGPNPVKKNGVQYNKNFKATKLVHGNSSQYRLSAAKNYDLLLDITKGKRLANPVRSVGHNRYKMWGGNIMQVNYKTKIPVKALQWNASSNVNDGSSNTILFPIECNNYYKKYRAGNIIDPSNNVFYAPCYFSTPGHIPPWIQSVADKKPIFKNTYYYLQGANADPLRGMSYPEEVYFKRHEPCLQDDTACLKNCA